MAAPKGNKYALGHHKGREPLYKDPEALETVAMEYFDLCTTTTGICKPTMSGLIFHLGFNSRQSLTDYRKRNEVFADIITRLRLFVESCYEYNLHGYNWAGSAFALKNMNPKDWKDETHQQVTQTVTEVKPQVVTSSTPLADSEERIKE